MSDNIRLWPQGLQKIARVIGPGPTLRLADHVGGLDKQHVPARASLKHPWAQIIGFENLQKLCAAFGRQRIFIPRGSFTNLKKVQIMDLIEQGYSSKAIALEVGCTERWVQMVRSGDPEPPDEKQMKLL